MRIANGSAAPEAGPRRQFGTGGTPNVQGTPLRARGRAARPTLTLRAPPLSSTATRAGSVASAGAWGDAAGVRCRGAPFTKPSKAVESHTYASSFDLPVASVMSITR
jgi:hypothetical protein